ncbi:MAG: response regulator transcription factor [Lachnospiraceae bacterium]|nr:response regulator transcription factor [Lachnospiraceae bacterium]
MTGYKLLIVDDDKDLALVTSDMLNDYGYDTQIAASAEETFELLKTEKFNLILLDINLPDGTGFEVCRELRRVSGVPVIFASARTREDDKIHGLDLGGDDYIEKPYSLKELLARINALIRRTYGNAAEEIVYQFGDIRVDSTKRQVTKAGTPIKMAMKEFDVLVYLCAHANSAVTKEELLREVWGMFSEAEIATVAVHIRWLREKLEEDPSHPRWIKTVWGVGYTLETGE